MHFPCSVQLAGASLLLSMTACSMFENRSTRYIDTSHLEAPPRMTIKSPPAGSIDEEALSGTGLGKVVRLARIEEKPVIRVVKLFDRSWELVEKSLEQLKIEITDKDRSKGVFYLNYDPEAEEQEEESLFDTVTFNVFSGSDTQGQYKLLINWNDSHSLVIAEQVTEENKEPLDDNEYFYVEPTLGEAKLIRTLYKTMREDLILN